MSSTMPVGARDLLRHGPFLFFLLSRSLSRFASQIAAVAIGWQIYDITGSAFQLGMVGLVQFLPTALLVFVAGHAADRFERKRVVQLCQLAEAATALFLAVSTFAGWLTVAQIFIATFVIGIAGAFESPATAALLPLIAPKGSVQRATAISSGAAQVATITGPALGGLAYVFAPSLPYFVIVVFWLVGAVLTGFIHATKQELSKPDATADDVFAGVRFIRNNPAILGTISLDLFAVLLGGATALLPVYAKDVFQVGPWGLGLLRAAPAAGALISLAVLTRRPLEARIGRIEFTAVAVFGIATIVFGLSGSFWISMLALAVLGSADSVSVVIRMTLVQIETPDDLRGRVSAVNSLFVSMSNQIGDFRAGTVAAWIGTTAAVLLGGFGTLVVVAACIRAFPELYRLESFRYGKQP